MPGNVNYAGQPHSAAAPLPPEAAEGANRLQSLLERLGVGDLYEQARTWLIEGKSEAEILLELRGTDRWKQRFAANEIRRANGLPLLDEEVIVQWENQAKAVARGYGLPAGFWDGPEDFAQLIGNNWSAAEYERKVVNGFARVADAPQEVRDAFNVYFGVQGDAMLATFFLDPERAVSTAEQAVNTALAGGTASRYGFTVGKDQASRIGSLGLTDDQLNRGFETLGQSRSLLNETVTETTDLTDEQGAAAVFGTDATAATAFDKRRQERAASTQGGGGVTQARTGRTGAGSST